MPNRNAILKIIDKDQNFYQTNIENGEFSYPEAFKRIGKSFNPICNKNGRKYQYLDIRFIDKKERIAVLVETKQDFCRNLLDAEEQINAYMSYEYDLTGYSIIGILANTRDDDNKIKAWHLYNSKGIKHVHLLEGAKVLTVFQDYVDMIKPKKINNRERVMRSTYELNEMMHKYGILEKLRSQFVGTCLIALNDSNFRENYRNYNTKLIIASIHDILSAMLTNNLEKANKLSLLNTRVLGDQCIRTLKDNDIRSIIDSIYENIYPYINDKTTLGQDLLNLFFTIFNKYVGKTDKNQAFTPDHIVNFMCKAIGIGKNSIVLDPCCGSGAFLVRAMTDALDKCDTEEERRNVKESHIFGIEYEDTAFGLSTTNMLLHGDGNSNVIQGNCFEKLQELKDKGIDRVLMNPPYNATGKCCDARYTRTWSTNQKEDPSKGFHFVYETAKAVKHGMMAVLLPMQCAIGSDREIQKFKAKMLEENHLVAVFTLPADIFHPGASANACCMIFEMGIAHKDALQKETFFGYYKEDGFVKKKNLGRVEKRDGIWNETMTKWLDAFANRREISGFSVLKQVTAEDEWLAEAYMETDYSTLTDKDFENTIRDFLAYKIKFEDR